MGSPAGVAASAIVSLSAPSRTVIAWLSNSPVTATNTSGSGEAVLAGKLGVATGVGCAVSPGPGVGAGVSGGGRVGSAGTLAWSVPIGASVGSGEALRMGDGVGDTWPTFGELSFIRTNASSAPATTAEAPV